MAVVPALALIILAGYLVAQLVVDTNEADEELRRIEVIGVLADIQTANILPEAAVLFQRLEEEPGMLGSMVGQGGLALVMERYDAAEAARQQLAASEGSRRKASMADIPTEAWEAFEAQDAAIANLIAELEATRSASAETVAELERTRDAADLELQRLGLSSTSLAWVVYTAQVRVHRISLIQYFYLGPGILGLDAISQREFIKINGRLDQATEDVLSYLALSEREKSEEILNSAARQRWHEYSLQAERVLGGEVEPGNILQYASLTADAQGLLVEIDAIGAAMVSRIQNDVALRSDIARNNLRNVALFASSLLALTAVLTLAILRSVVRPVEILTARVALIAGGRLDLGRRPVGGRDELTRLGDVLDDMVSGLKHVERQVRAITAGQLSDPSLGTAAPGPLGKHLQRHVDGLRHASTELKETARTDPLTGLLNRRGVTDTLVEAGDRASWGSVLYIDLDRFKQINDEHGHKHGDAVLEIVAARLSSIARAGDLVTRLGGDEFAILVSDHSEEGIEALVARVKAQVSEPMHVEGVAHSVGASVGSAVFDHELEPDIALATALEQADLRMLEEKACGKNSERRRTASRGVGRDAQ